MIGKSSSLQLVVIPGVYAVSRLPANATLPVWATQGRFFSLTRTPNELSIVCETAVVPSEIQKEVGWRALEVTGPLDFGLTGILAALSTVLAAAEISIFAVSTYDTDYVLVRESALQRAVFALRGAGHIVGNEETDAF